MAPMDRRGFFRLGLGLGAGALAWACSRSGDQVADSPETTPGALSVVATGLQLGVGDSRQGIVLLEGQTPITPDELTVRLTPPAGSPTDVEVQRQQVRRGLGGTTDEENPDTTEVLDIYVVRHPFDTAGVWALEATADGQTGQAVFQVAGTSDAPTVGSQAIASQSPTTADPRGVDPICTRTPPCSMHEVTIADALETGDPLVVIFGTPRYCTSRTCGPVVDRIEEAAEQTDGVTFVHVEIWKDDEDSVNQPGGESPVFAEWGLGTEPWTYFIDADGVVRDRWLGPVGAAELETTLSALGAGEL